MRSASGGGGACRRAATLGEDSPVSGLQHDDPSCDPWVISSLISLTAEYLCNAAEMLQEKASAVTDDRVSRVRADGETDLLPDQSQLGAPTAPSAPTSAGPDQVQMEAAGWPLFWLYLKNPIIFHWHPEVLLIRNMQVWWQYKQHLKSNCDQLCTS